MDNLDVKELEKMLKDKKKVYKKEKKRMKFGKKILNSAFVACSILVLFTMVMIYFGKDTTSLTILAGAGVGILPIMYGIYDNYNTKINLMHMEKNYNPNYDDENNIY